MSATNILNKVPYGKDNFIPFKLCGGALPTSGYPIYSEVRTEDY